MNDSLLANKLGALWCTIDGALDDAFGDLSESSAAALLTLLHHQPLTTTQLSRILGLTQPATTRLVDKIAALDFLAKKARPRGKELDLRLTEKGRRAARRLQEARLSALQSLLADLNESQRAQLHALLNEMLAAPVQSRTYARRTCRFCDHAVCDGPLCPIGAAATEIEKQGDAS